MNGRANLEEAGIDRKRKLKCIVTKYRVYQNDWSGFEVDYIHKYGEQNYKY